MIKITSKVISGEGTAPKEVVIGDTVLLTATTDSNQTHTYEWYIRSAPKDSDAYLTSPVGSSTTKLAVDKVGVYSIRVWVDRQGTRPQTRTISINVPSGAGAGLPLPTEPQVSNTGVIPNGSFEVVGSAPGYAKYWAVQDDASLLSTGAGTSRGRIEPLYFDATGDWSMCLGQDGSYTASANVGDIFSVTQNVNFTNVNTLSFIVQYILEGLMIALRKTDGSTVPWAGTDDGYGKIYISGIAPTVDIDSSAIGTIDDTAPTSAELTGAIARSSQQANMTAGDLANLVSTLAGELVIAGYDWGNSWLDINIAGSDITIGGESEGDIDSTAPTKATLFGSIARTAQQAAVAAGDLVNTVTNAYGELVLAGYDWASNLIRTQEQNPLSEQWITSELIDDTTVAIDTKEYIIDVSGYRDFAIHYNIDGTSGATIGFTVYGTIDDDASPEWIDITKAGYNANTNAHPSSAISVSSASETSILVFENLPVYKIKIEVEITNASANQVSVWTKFKAI